MCICWRRPGLLFSVLCSASLCKATNTQQGTGCTSCDLWPLPTATDGVEVICQRGLIWPPTHKPSHSTSCSEQSALRLNQSRCFSVTPRTELRLFFFWPSSREADISTELHGQSGLQEAAAADPSQLVCTIMYSPSPLCLTTPFLYSNGETLLVYEFDICTNAPLWKRKWNLDISGINVWTVSSFLFTNTSTAFQWSGCCSFTNVALYLACNTSL